MAVQSGVYRGVSAADRVADRRRRLLEAGLAVWSDPDTRTTMTAVCAAAGLTERYFYESFRGLDDLLEAVLDQVAAEIEATSLAAADQAVEPVERVHAGMRAFVQLLVDDPRKGRIITIESVAVPRLRERRTALLRHLAHRAAKEAHDAFGLPLHEVAENETAGLVFIGGMAELITAWLDGTVEATPDDIIDIATKAFIGLYG